jgi:hypothetical protein
MLETQNTLSPNQVGDQLTVCVERLDVALQAIESHMQALGDSAPKGPNLLHMAETDRLKAEVSALKAREKILEEAAKGAFIALGEAAQSIKLILDDEAA